jgi:hypothetical protein
VPNLNSPLPSGRVSKLAIPYGHVRLFIVIGLHKMQLLLVGHPSSSNGTRVV